MKILRAILLTLWWIIRTAVVIIAIFLLMFASAALSAYLVYEMFIHMTPYL